MIGKLKDLLVQKKLYVVAIMVGLGALAAFADGQLTTIQLGAVVGGLLLLMTKKAGENRREEQLKEIAEGIKAGKVNTGVVMDELLERLKG